MYSLLPLASNDWFAGAPDLVTPTQHKVNVDVCVNEPRSGGMIAAPGERAQRA